jgi:aspartyl-tRNA(Asn)/glutamyl-tRNA(Gln) amidotransferase subunit A
MAADFRAGKDDPVRALERALQAADRGRDDQAILWRREEARADAEAARARFQSGQPRGPLDGVPVVVKDCVDVAGLPSTNGTRFLTTPAAMDAELVSRLRQAGAVLFAKTNMHELGILPFGINPHHGTPRNPWDGERMPGGSSSGTAVAVASGIAACGVGTDAGGSIRVPACFNGLVGLKPGYGAVPDTGVANLTDDLDHAGPIGWTVDDVTALFEVLAGRTVDRALEPGRAAVLSDLFPGADAEVAEPVRAAIARCFPGATEVATPMCRHATAVEAVIVGSDAARRFPRSQRAELGPDARLILALGEGFSAEERRRADRVRQAMREELASALERADVLLSPMTSCLAPTMHPGDRGGVLDIRTMARVAAISFVGNLTGLPSVTVPCVRAGLPVGLQILARDEARALAAARVVERAYGPRRPPRWHGV